MNRKALLTACCLILATGLAAESSDGFRILCRPANKVDKTLADSTKDLRALIEKDARLTLVEDAADADVLVEILERGVVNRTRHETHPGPVRIVLPRIYTCRMVKARILWGKNSEDVSAEYCSGSAGNWTMAASSLRKEIRSWLDRNEEGVLQAGAGFPDLGLRYETYTKQLRKQLKMKKGRGVIILEIAPGGAAEAAGLQARDLIEKANDAKTKKSMELTRALARCTEGRVISLLVRREGSKKKIPVALHCPTTLEGVDPDSPGS